MRVRRYKLLQKKCNERGYSQNPCRNQSVFPEYILFFSITFSLSSEQVINFRSAPVGDIIHREAR